ncbi:hypothetical protein FBULB1_9001 [Fusarium bulbicola]|nr:hypothetical protein FBULB1_9001 [Fusarium bulbicola]
MTNATCNKQDNDPIASLPLEAGGRGKHKKEMEGSLVGSGDAAGLPGVEGLLSEEAPGPRPSTAALNSAKILCSSTLCLTRALMLAACPRGALVASFRVQYAVVKGVRRGRHVPGQLPRH